MTTVAITEELPPVSSRLPGAQGVTRLVSLAGIALMASAYWSEAHESTPVAVAAAVLSLLGWTALTLLPRSVPLWPRLVLLGTMIATGALAASLFTGIASVAVLIGSVMAFGSASVPFAVAVILTASAPVVIGVCALIAPQPSQLVAVGYAAAGVLIGIARRQARAASERERRTARRLIDAHRELAASAARDERARIARDLHDVLAHTLGGLVVQLDAVEGLAEAGRLDEAAARARAARELAADGLRDARVAVGVLDGTRSVELADLAEQARSLVAAERRLGAVVTAHIDDLNGAAAPALIDAFRWAVREALTNARKHAPGQAVRLRLTTEGRMLTLEVANDVSGAERHGLADTGAGMGLRGIRSRVDGLPDGEASAADGDGEFVLRVRARTS